MMRHRDATGRLQRVLLADAIAAGCTIAAVEADSHNVPWRSACFDATRHYLHFAAHRDDQLERWLAALDTREWRVPGQLVIDWSEERDGDRLILTALALDPDTA